jgi:F0F1-type ATP synthase membrane subunit b/b'
MDKIIHQLGELLLTALPTFLLIIFLNYYLKFVFFKPLEKALKQRYDATEGARKLAEASLQRADAKTAEYEATLRAARNEIYQAQEQAYKELQERVAAQVAETRAQSDAAIKQARAGLAQDVDAAKAGLAQDSEALANQIAESILRRRAA